MATINKKLSQTKFERVGDTQGLMIPVSQSIFGQFTSAQNAAVESTFKPLRVNMSTLSNTFGGDLSVIDEATGTRFVSNCDGNLLNVNFGRMYCDVVPPTLYRMIILINSAANGRTVDIIQQANGGGSINRWLEGNLSYTVRLDRNDSFRLGFYDFNPANVNVDNVSTVATFNIVKIAQNAPYIIANKGALKSGGAFTFDSDGNCYTENYSTTEMRVGKWIDGKDIFRKTFQISTPAMVMFNSYTVGDWRTLISPNLKQMLSHTISEYRNDSNSMSETVGGVLRAKLDFSLVLVPFSDWSPAGFTFNITVEYTKV